MLIELHMTTIMMIDYIHTPMFSEVCAAAKHGRPTTCIHRATKHIPDSLANVSESLTQKRTKIYIFSLSSASEFRLFFLKIYILSASNV